MSQGGTAVDFNIGPPGNILVPNAQQEAQIRQQLANHIGVPVEQLRGGFTQRGTAPHFHYEWGPQNGQAARAGLSAAASLATSPISQPSGDDESDLATLRFRGANNIIPQGMQFADMQANALAQVYNTLLSYGRGMEALGVLDQMAQAHNQIEALSLEQDVFAAIAGDLQPLAQRLANATQSNIEVSDNGDGTYTFFQDNEEVGTATASQFITMSRALLDRQFRQTQAEVAAQRAERQAELAGELQLAYLTGAIDIEEARIRAAAAQGGFEITDFTDAEGNTVVAVIDRRTGRTVRVDRYGEVPGPRGTSTYGVTQIPAG
jgi:hypothetical protein